MYHSFFVDSSVDGQLGCFHVLAIVYSAAMNYTQGACVFFGFGVQSPSAVILEPKEIKSANGILLGYKKECI